MRKANPQTSYPSSYIIKCGREKYKHCFEADYLLGYLIIIYLGVYIFIIMVVRSVISLWDNIVLKMVHYTLDSLLDTGLVDKQSGSI